MISRRSSRLTRGSSKHAVAGVVIAATASAIAVDNDNVSVEGKGYYGLGRHNELHNDSMIKIY